MQHILSPQDCPDRAIEAAAWFHVTLVPRIAQVLADRPDVTSIVVVLPHAPYDHRDWRLAAMRDLARRFAPCRINMVTGDAGTALDAICGYLENAPGVTGQCLKSSGPDD